MEICPIFKASSHLLQDIRDLKIKVGLNPPHNGRHYTFETHGVLNSRLNITISWL